MPPDMQPWIAVAAVGSSAAMVFSFVRIWRRRIERADRLRTQAANRPVDDPFKSVLQLPGQARTRDTALGVPPLVPLGEVAWSVHIPGPPDAWLYLENAENPRLVAVCAASDPPAAEDLDAIAAAFGIAPDATVENGLLYLTVPAADVTAPFDRLCLAAAAVDAADPPNPRTRAHPAVLSWFADGIEYGALPPFGRVYDDDESGVYVVARSALSYRQGAAPRLRFGLWRLSLTGTVTVTADRQLPTDVLVDEPVVRVIGGDPVDFKAWVASK